MKYWIKDQDGNIENTIIWNGTDNYPLPDGYTVEQCPPEEDLPTEES